MGSPDGRRGRPGGRARARAAARPRRRAHRQHVGPGPARQGHRRPLDRDRARARSPGSCAMLYELGFQPQPGPDPWPPTRPMPVGSLELDGTQYRIHLHVQPARRRLPARHRVPRRAPQRPRAPAPVRGAEARRSPDAGPVEGLRYTHSKTAWILQVYRRLGFAPPPIAPPSTIGILGGGQLGRMLGLAARELGYRIVGARPGPELPRPRASPTGSRSRRYDDVDAAQRLAAECSVITYELEHVGQAVVTALDDRQRPDPARAVPAQAHRGPARRAAVHRGERGRASRRGARSRARRPSWRQPPSSAIRSGSRPSRGGYDGRSQVRIDRTDGIEALGRPDRLARAARARARLRGGAVASWWLAMSTA